MEIKETENEWEKHFKKLEDLNKVDDFDYYSKFSDSQLKTLLKNDKSKYKQINKEMEILNKKIEDLKDKQYLLDIEISLVERKLLTEK